MLGMLTRGLLVPHTMRFGSTTKALVEHSLKVLHRLTVGWPHAGAQMVRLMPQSALAQPQSANRGGLVAATGLFVEDATLDNAGGQAFSHASAGTRPTGTQVSTISRSGAQTVPSCYGSQRTMLLL